MRLFIAITLDESIREKLSAVQSELQQIQPDMKPVKPDNIHLTVRFLGEVAEENLPELMRAIAVVQNYPAFELDVKGLGAFPVERQPKVVWVRGADNSNTIEKLYSALEKELLNIGFQPDDHKFSAHITLGRNKLPKYNNEFRSLMNKYSLESFGRQAVNKVSLLQSVLMPAGPIYTNIRDFKLK
ncbi:MAG TPA: RNA 2',3'-cyclic phosphodiesterase [Planctomycetota bacterium]|nr:RNA 2',3'-cyclic phosphodiesterase [Planctomycetota bacterium]